VPTIHRHYTLVLVKQTGSNIGGNVTTALVIRPQAEKNIEIHSETAFGQFIEWLTIRNTKNAPIEEMIAAGMWVVMLSAGKKLGINVATEAQIEDVSSRVDRVINVGLRRKYGKNMFKAARAFEKEVLRTVERACKLGFRPGMNVSPTTWRHFANGNVEAMRRELNGQPVTQTGTLLSLVQIPAALFLMELMREAEELKGQLNRLATKVVNNDHVSKYVALTGIHSLDNTDIMVSILSLEVTGDRLIQTTVDDILTESNRLQEALTEQRHLKVLPFRPQDYQDVDGVVIKESWLNTQIYLAAGNVPDGQIFSAKKHWVTCATALNSLPTEEVARRFMARMKVRGLNCDKETHEWLTAYVIKQIKPLQGAKDSLVLDTGKARTLIIDVEPENLHVEEDDALKAATGAESQVEYSQNHQSKANDARLMKAINAAINWEEIDVEQIERMLTAETLDIEYIAKGICLMGEKHRAEAVNLLLQNPEMTAKAAETLFEQQVIELTPAIANQLRHLVSKTRYAEALNNWLLALSQPGQDEKAEKILIRGVITALCYVGSKTAKQVVQDITYRQTVVEKLVYSTAIQAARDDVGIPLVEAQAFTSLLGKDRTKFVLAREVINRVDSYQAKNSAELDRTGYSPPWAEINTPDFGCFAQHALEKFEPETVQRFLKKHPEDEVFRWLYEADPKVAQKLKGYQKLRERYYKKFPYEKMRQLADK